jgi:hypothetical protein
MGSAGINGGWLGSALRQPPHESKDEKKKDWGDIGRGLCFGSAITKS